MESTNSNETILWLVAGLVACGMIMFLSLGWLKGYVWERESKLKKRH